MADPRYQQLADVLVGYSTAVQPGDKVLIEATDTPHEFTRTLVRTVAAAGGHPLVTLKSNAVRRELMLCGSEEQMRLIGEVEAHRMAEVQAYIAVRGNRNVSELGDVPVEKNQLYQRLVWKPVHTERRIRHTRWTVMRWPNDSMAQLARMPTDTFTDFYFRVCTLDYARMARAMRPLKELMDATDRVRLVAPGTDLRFSIKDIGAVACEGKHNIPDGEVFSAPVRDSVEGTIRFNTPSVFQGVTHDNVAFTFRHGKIVEASSSAPEVLEATLDTDEGARHVGEFAIGFNPYITEPMYDILFDEKIAGSIHFTPGQAYDDAWNGNESEIHWDLVLRMAPHQGGGEVWFDDRLIRKDGRFVVPELEPLNPENLTY